MASGASAMETIRNIHWTSLAIGLFVLADRLMFHGRYPGWLLIGLPMTAFCVSVGCGMLMVRHHRADETFLPPLQYATYAAAELGWSWLVAAIAHDVLRVGPAADWMAVVLPWFMFIGPWLAFRRHRPTPLVVDGALITLAVVLAHAVATSARFLPSTRWLARDGYLALPIAIGITAWVLYRLKKAGIPELWGAAAWAAVLLIVAGVLLPTGT